MQSASAAEHSLWHPLPPVSVQATPHSRLPSACLVRASQHGVQPGLAGKVAVAEPPCSLKRGGLRLKVRLVEAQAVVGGDVAGCCHSRTQRRQLHACQPGCHVVTASLGQRFQAGQLALHVGLQRRQQGSECGPWHDRRRRPAAGVPSKRVLQAATGEQA